MRSFWAPRIETFLFATFHREMINLKLKVVSQLSEKRSIENCVLVSEKLATVTDPFIHFLWHIDMEPSSFQHVHEILLKSTRCGNGNYTVYLRFTKIFLQFSFWAKRLYFQHFSDSHAPYYLYHILCVNCFVKKISIVNLATWHKLVDNGGKKSIPASDSMS